MPYDLCEDEPTLDVIETCMAYQGKGGAAHCVAGTGDRASRLHARLMLSAQEAGRVLTVTLIRVLSKMRPQKAPGKRAVQGEAMSSPMCAGSLSWPHLLFVSCDTSVQSTFIIKMHSHLEK